MCVATGVEMVLHTRFDLRRVLEDISRKRVYFFSGVPTMYAALVNASQIANYDLSSLRVCGVGGAPISADVATRFRALTGLTLLDGYGLTEMSPVVTMQRLDQPPRPGAVGLPAPLTTITIVALADKTRVLDARQVGEICCEGPQLMKGYWRRPEETAAVIQDNRLHTGDIGYLDEDGYVYVLDRKKDMVFVGGHNVFPGKVEKVIAEYPLIDDVAVIGIPDAYFGYHLKAFVTLRDGAGAFESRGLERFLSGKLAAHEVPTETEVRDTLPKTAIGKLAKQELLAQEQARRQGQ
jgi:long-chain acyl-CoA synthetase